METGEGYRSKKDPSPSHLRQQIGRRRMKTPTSIRLKMKKCIASVTSAIKAMVRSILVKLSNQRQGKSTFQDLSTILDLKGRGTKASSNARLRRKTKCRSLALSHGLQGWTREEKSFISELILTWSISQNKTYICLNNAHSTKELCLSSCFKVKDLS